MSRNPMQTNLKSFGRVHRDEPFYGYLKVRIYPKSDTIPVEDLAEWCGDRYLSSRSGRKAPYRIGGYKHINGRQYVDRLYIGDLSDKEMFDLSLRFGDWLDTKVVRDGNLRRPRLTKEEKVARDALIEQFYADIRAKRMAAIVRESE